MTTCDTPEVVDHPVRAFWRTRRVELAGSVVFLVFVAWPFVRRSGLVAGLDTYSYSAPNDAVTFDALRSLRLPQWNPWIFGGVPHLANPQVALFNPLKLPFVAFDPWRAVMLVTALHLLVLTVGMVVLVHRLRLRPPAGFVAAVAIAGSGLVAIKSVRYPQVTVLAGIPWLLVALDLALDRPVRPRRAIAWVAVATAFVCVAGHPQMAFLAVALGGAWTLSRAIRHDTWRDLWRVAAGVGLGAALAAVQLLPSLTLLADAAERTEALSGNPAYTFPRGELARSLFGDVWANNPEGVSGAPEGSSWVGVVVALLALVGILDALRRRRERAAAIVLLATAAVAVTLAQGGSAPLHRLARDVVPLFDQARVPARWMALVTLLFAVFAAMGTDALVAQRVDRALAAALGATMLVIAVLVAANALARPGPGTAATWLALAALTVGAFVLVVRACPPWSWLAVAVLLVLAVTELGAMASRSAPRRETVPASIAGTTGPAVDHLRAHPAGRVVAMTQERYDDVVYMLEGLRPNANADRAVRSIDGYDGGPQVRATWVELASALTDGRPDAELTLRAQAALPLDPNRYARFGVRYALIDTSVVPAGDFVPGWRQVVGTTGPLQLFENPRWAGDAFLYRATRRVEREPGRVVRTMSADELRNVALVGPDAPLLQCASDCARRRASVRRETPEHLVVDTNADVPSLLALTEQWDDGWSAQLDGDDVDVVKVDGFMLGVAVPAGDHSVTFRYRAPGLRAGIVVSLLAAIAVVVLLVTGRRPRSMPVDQ